MKEQAHQVWSNAFNISNINKDLGKLTSQQIALDKSIKDGKVMHEKIVSKRTGGAQASRHVSNV